MARPSGYALSAAPDLQPTINKAAFATGPWRS